MKPAPPETSPLPLPAALPISRHDRAAGGEPAAPRARQQPQRGERVGDLEERQSLHRRRALSRSPTRSPRWGRSEEHTSELQSQSNLVCRLLLEKKKETWSHNC